jgi:fibronectin type 3 domain-containing protein
MVVRRATNPGFTTGLASFTLGAAATSYTDTSVAEGTTYYYQVQAENEVSNSAWSNPVSITFTTVPAAPSGLTATLTASSAVSLTWTVNASTCPATQLRIERATDSGFTSHVADTLAGPALSTYTDTTVVQGTDYYYRVRAENEVSSSAWSNTVSVWVRDVISATGPGDQSSVVGDHVQLPPIQATSSTGLPLTFSASGLPAGLSIDPNAGVISGTVTTAGSYTPTVTITDTSGASASVRFNWTVAADTISVTSPGSQSTYIGFPASLQIRASSGAGLPLRYSATGLPPGLSISSSGLITGTAAGPAGSYTPAVTVTDGTASNSVTFTWTVKAAAVVYSGTIRLIKMGYCLDDRNSRSASGAVVQVWRCTGGPNQVWQVMSDGTIRHNGLCLEAPGTANGTKVVLATCTPGAPLGPDQQWNTKDWRVNYTNPSAVGKVLNDAGYGGNGTQQVLWSNTGTINEIWATS